VARVALDVVDSAWWKQQLRVKSAGSKKVASLMRCKAQALLRAALAAPCGLVLAVVLTIGVLPREYLALKWQDLDWTRQAVSIVRRIGS